MPSLVVSLQEGCKRRLKVLALDRRLRNYNFLNADIVDVSVARMAPRI